MLTWAIPDDFGGVTSVLLQRSRLLAGCGASVEVLTLAGGRSHAEVRARLQREGHLGPGVVLRNLWEDLAGRRDTDLGRRRWHRPPPPPEGFEPLTAATTDRVEEQDGRVVRRVRTTADGSATAQTDHLRPDGSLLVSDRRDADLPTGRRLVTVCDRRGRPLQSWPSARAFYFWWLDLVLGGGPAHLISDSKFVGSFLHEYRRPDVVVAQVVHSSHLSDQADGTLGELSEGKAALLRSAQDFDALVLLTATQARELEDVLGPARNRYVVPNARAIPEVDVSAPRDPARGVLVGRLTNQKRIDHAVRAVARVGPVGAREPRPVVLRVLGEGEDREQLQGLVEELGLGDRVVLAGHSRQVVRELAEASFSVLSSREEGMPLALVESMAAGCVPVAYDVRYGPADIIRDGVDGFLVPAGDVDALAAAIGRVVTMPEAERAAMRSAARERAHEFSEEAMVRRWAETLRAARAAKVPPRPLEVGAGPVEAHSTATGAVLSLTVSTTADDVVDPAAFLVLRGRGSLAYLRRPLRLRPAGARAWHVEGSVEAAEVGWVTRGTLDVNLELRDARGAGTVRLAAPGADPVLLGPGPVRLVVTRHGNLSLRGFAGG
nr:glycosyltransferase [Auraticoccus cholistanensis]